MLENSLNHQNEEALELHNMQIISRLGRGSNSHVFKAQSLKTNKIYALKVIDKKSSTFSQTITLRQINIHRKMQHPNLLSIINHIQDQDNHYIFTEYCQDGQATRLLKHDLSYPQLANMIEQICRGLSYMHEVASVCHCDLKLSNILLDGSFIKLCDFGYSTAIAEDCNKVAGTLIYMAPQILKQQKRQYMKEADVWALGIIILTLILKKQPYQARNHEELKRLIMQQKPIIPNTIELPLLDLLHKILQPNPLIRIKVHQIMSHTFISTLPKLKSIILPRNRTFSQTKRQLSTTIIKEESYQNLQEKGNKIKNKLPPINSLCLSPQSYRTRLNNQIIVDESFNITIKIKNIQAFITSNGQLMSITKNNHQLQYQYIQLALQKQDQNRTLYQYARNVIGILKEREVKWQQIRGQDRYWLSKDQKILSGIVNGERISHKLKANNVLVNRSTILKIKQILGRNSDDFLRLSLIKFMEFQRSLSNHQCLVNQHL